MRVRALRAQPDARSGRRRRRWLLVVGDAALAVALAAAFYLATGDHYGDRLAGVEPAPGGRPAVEGAEGGCGLGGAAVPLGFAPVQADGPRQTDGRKFWM